MDRNDDNSSAAQRLRRRVSKRKAKLASVIPEAYLRSIFDDMFEGIQIIDFSFRYVYVNKTAASHGRRLQEELIGQRLDDMYPGFEQTEVFQLLRQCMTERMPQQRINHFVYPDGRAAWFDLRIRSGSNGYSDPVGRHLRRGKTVQEHLRQSQEDLATTLQCMAEGVMRRTLRVVSTRMNPAAARALTGCGNRRQRPRWKLNEPLSVWCVFSMGRPARRSTIPSNKY